MFDYGADLQNAYDEGYKKGKADAVRHGRWIESTTDLICSSCETVFNDELAYMCRDYTYGYPRYCPYCGAKMDEEE